MNSTTDPELIGKVSALRSTHGTAVSFKLDSSASRSRSGRYDASANRFDGLHELRMR